MYYIIIYVRILHTIYVLQVYQGLLQNCRVTKLHEHTDYQFTICAENSAGEGPESPPLTVTTCRAPPHSLKGKIPFRFFSNPLRLLALQVHWLSLCCRTIACVQRLTLRVLCQYFQRQTVAIVMFIFFEQRLCNLIIFCASLSFFAIPLSHKTSHQRLDYCCW